MADPKLTVKLKPLRQGFRRHWAAHPDEDLDGPIRSEVIDGDSSKPVIDPGDPKGLSGWFMGDGGIGTKQVDLVADGHVGDGEVEIRVRFVYDVVHPDATDLGVSVDDTSDAPIPTA